MREQIASEIWQPPAGETPEEDTGVIKIGDTVRIKEAGLTGTVLSISEASQEVEVQAGKTKMRLGLNSVVKTTPTADKFAPPPRIPPPAEYRWSLTCAASAPMKWNRRWMPISTTPRSRISSEARIIHGIATGTVRSIVRDFLKNHPLAKSFRTGGRDEGGDGVTVVRL